MKGVSYMATAKIDLADLFRQIQSLRLAPKGCLEKEMKLDFFKTVFETFAANLEHDSFQTLIPIEFKICSIDKAKKTFSIRGSLFYLQRFLSVND